MRRPTYQDWLGDHARLGDVGRISPAARWLFLRVAGPLLKLWYRPQMSGLENLPGPTGIENLRTLAIARLMLDNIPHAKTFWIMQTLGMSQLMLDAGADDLDGTVVWYDITHLGGASTHQETTSNDLRRAALEAGCTPIERDTLYRRVERHGAEWSLAEGADAPA